MTNLRIPGPTPLPPQVLDAMQRPMIAHRGPEAKALIGELRAALARLHRTSGEVFLFPGSGTGAMEAALANLFSAGDRVLGIISGQFGIRFATIARAYGLEVVELPVEWGRAVEPQVVRDVLRRHPDVKGVLFTHNETSTAITNPLQEIGPVVREHGDGQTLLLVDAVSSVGAVPLEMDAWGADAVLSGTQKAWMCPPGLAVVAVGERVWPAHQRSTLPRFFWDFTLARKAAAENGTHVTPPLTTLYALHAAVRMIEEEGLEQVWARHATLGAYVRAGVKELGLGLLADEAHASNRVTAVVMPGGIAPKQLLAHVRERYGVTMASGQGPLADKVIRIGHMGFVHEPELAEALDALESALGDLGYREGVERGARSVERESVASGGRPR